MFDVIKLCSKLAHFHWSPKHPDEYVIQVQGMPSGLGRIAHKDYAAFNLAYVAVQGKLSDLSDHKAAIARFVPIQILLNTVVNGRELRDYALALTEAEFIVWYEKNRSTLDKPIRSQLDAIFRRHGQAADQAL